MGNLLATSSDDPFTLVYCGLLDMLESHQDLVNLVAPANRIKWLGVGGVDAEKDQVTDSDRPQWRLDPAETFANVDLETGASLLRLNWTVAIASDTNALDNAGNKGLGGSVFPVMWSIYRALLGYQQQILQLQYNGAAFVYMVETGTPFISRRAAQEQGRLAGWTAGWNYSTWLSFNTLANLPTPVS